MRYLYYTLWQLLNRIKTNDTPATNAMILIIVCQMINLLTVYCVINLTSFLETVVLPKSRVLLFTAVIGVIFYIVNYFTLYKKGDLLHEKYKNKTKKQMQTGWIMLGLYFFGSFFLAIYFGVKVSNSIVN